MKRKLIEQIAKKQVQLDKLAEHVEKSCICSQLYNKVVIEKAILKKQLDDLNKNKLAEKVVRLFPHKKTLICDYFQ
ncbi:MAG: hypothetical protein VZR09_01675 [Candidatus Gastranaerophilaceae bacterium]|nr:hypothetical protein [Candidatus Gastranaerophilaceae bacterium]